MGLATRLIGELEARALEREVNRFRLSGVCVLVAPWRPIRTGDGGSVGE